MVTNCHAQIFQRTFQFALLDSARPPSDEEDEDGVGHQVPANPNGAEAQKFQNKCHLIKGVAKSETPAHNNMFMETQNRQVALINT